MAGTIEENVREELAQARAEAKGFNHADSKALNIRLDAIEHSLIKVAEALDNAWARLARPPD